MDYGTLLWMCPNLIESSKKSCTNVDTGSKGNGMNQLTLIELYDLVVQLIEIKNSEHVALQHDPIQQVVSDRVYQNVIDIIRERVKNERA
jgi:hypothetical protein